MLPELTVEKRRQLSVVVDAELRSREATNDLDRCLDDFKYWRLTYVQTVYTDPQTEARSFRPYPDYPYLDDYTRELLLPGLLAVPKSRGMIATTHPLLLSLHRCFYVWKRGGIWRTALLRQNKDHAEELISRVRATWERLPESLRPPLEIDNLDNLTFVGGGLMRALPEEGETGRGEDWDMVVHDEGSHQEHLAENIGAFGPRTRTQVAPSTFNGEGNTFARLVDGDDYPGRRVFYMPIDIHPHRRPGTPEGEAYLALMRTKMSKADFAREIMMARDVYGREGYYGSDWNPAVVRPVEWDGKGVVTIGMDYAYVNPAAVVSYVNEFGQWCRIRESLDHNIALETYATRLFEDCLRWYPHARFRVAPDPFRGRQTKGDVDGYGNPATDLATITRLARSILGPDTITSISRIGDMLRAEGHRRVRRVFAMREDERYGTIIDPSCKLLIQGFGGAYGPRDNATDGELQREEPDSGRLQVHVMDADRYGLCEFVQTDRGLEFQRPSEEPRVVHMNSVPIHEAIRARRAMV